LSWGAALAAGVPLIKKGAGVFAVYSFTLLVVFVAIALWKGEKPHWSWKKPE
jgi:hypothetical protein